MRLKASKKAFNEFITTHSSLDDAKAGQEELMEIILDIQMLLYTYDPEMPLTRISQTFPDAMQCMVPEICGKTKANTSGFVTKTLDRFIKHLRRK